MLWEGKTKTICILLDQQDRFDELCRYMNEPRLRSGNVRELFTEATLAWLILQAAHVKTRRALSSIIERKPQD